MDLTDKSTYKFVATSKKRPYFGTAVAKPHIPCRALLCLCLLCPIFVLRKPTPHSFEHTPPPFSRQRPAHPLPTFGIAHRLCRHRHQCRHTRRVACTARHGSLHRTPALQRHAKTTGMAHSQPHGSSGRRAERLHQQGGNHGAHGLSRRTFGTSR